LKRLASKGVEAYEMIRKNVLNSGVIGTDETSVKINGEKIGSGPGNISGLPTLLPLTIAAQLRLLRI
jgi:hypothetical protein